MRVCQNLLPDVVNEAADSRVILDPRAAERGLARNIKDYAASFIRTQKAARRNATFLARFLGNLEDLGEIQHDYLVQLGRAGNFHVVSITARV